MEFKYLDKLRELAAHDRGAAGSSLHRRRSGAQRVTNAPVSQRPRWRVRRSAQPSATANSPNARIKTVTKNMSPAGMICSLVATAACWPSRLPAH
jgi:hypothetical protein